MIYRKKYMEKILPFVDTPFVKIFTGIRRCGKSTIMQMLREALAERGIKAEQILFYKLDSLEYENMTNIELFNEIKAHLCKNGKTYIFLDEIQEVESWEKTVNSLMSGFDTDIYVTGSNSRMMSGEISTYLTGRYISFRIFPLTFSEYLDFREAYTEKGNLKDEFTRFMRFGGFPAIHLRNYSEDEAYTIVRDIYNSTIFTDIVKRNEIRKVDQLERVVKYAFDNAGRIFSGMTLSKYMKKQNRTMDPETVYSYLEKLEKAYILHRCQRYDIKGKEFLKTQEKFYLADTSLRYSVLGYNSDTVSAMMENIIYIELLSRGYSVYVGKMDSFEIDFVVIRQNEKLYIQVCREINTAKTETREYENLHKIKDNYPKYVVRMDDFADGNSEGIRTMHISDFLLSSEY